MRARQDAAQGRTKKQYDTVRIRVRFSDRTQIEQVFPHTAKIADVYALVDNALHEAQRGEYTLFQSPPKRDFSRLDAATLVQLGFAPAAVLGIRWADPRRNSTFLSILDKNRLTNAATDMPAPLREDLVAKARDMPPAPSFATQIPSVRQKNTEEPSSDAQNAREKRKFPKVRRTAHPVV